MHASGGDARAAALRLSRSVLGLYVSAYQSWLFNRVLAERLPSVDRPLPGDIVWSHATGRCAHVADPAEESPRVARLAVSPTGPMAGRSMEKPTLEAGQIEARVLAEAGCDPDALPRTGPLSCLGARRPLRFPLEHVHLEPGADEAGRYLELRFTLPPGCYATAVLREICKDGLRDGTREADPDEGGVN
jgi:tRNA pseudouridine13 synthase